MYSITEKKQEEQNKKFQWFINIYNNKIKINLFHFLYLEINNIDSEEKIPKCIYCNEYCEISNLYNVPFFSITCGNKDCMNKYKGSEKHKQNIRIAINNPFLV